MLNKESEDFAQGSAFDFVIVGSGFGGSVSAMRLAQKGYSVLVLEQGTDFRDGNFARTNWDLRRFLWFPLFRLFGIQGISFLDQVMVLHGVGVGGGSLVYANTLMTPRDHIFRTGGWDPQVDWAKELRPYYERAEKMLGVTEVPRLFSADKALRDVADDLGVGSSFEKTRVGVFFGSKEANAADPYFLGQGPARSACNYCGACMVGCRFNAKNTLDKNYLYFAEKFGAQIRSRSRVDRIEALGDGGYRLRVVPPGRWVPGASWVRAQRIVLSAGVLGTLRLLFEARDRHKTLPRISAALGTNVRTNGESLVGATAFDDQRNYSEGVAIASAIHPDTNTKIEAVRYPMGSDLMRWLAVPLVPGAPRWLRPLLLPWVFLRSFPRVVRHLFSSNWAGRTVILLVMQSLESKIDLVFRRRWRVWGWRGVGAQLPHFLPIAQSAAHLLEKRMGGFAQNAASEVVLGKTATAHILGGCAMSTDPRTGVVNEFHEVFGHTGLFVCDGSVVPGNLGVNPSLTISALAERFSEQFPVHDESRFRQNQIPFSEGGL